MTAPARLVAEVLHHTVLLEVTAGDVDLLLEGLGHLEVTRSNAGAPTHEVAEVQALSAWISYMAARAEHQRAIPPESPRPDHLHPQL